MTATVLIFDVGSTFTKVTALSEQAGELRFEGRAEAPTTVRDIEAGLAAAEQALRGKNVAVADRPTVLASSSAAGGLRMVALGYMPRVTVKAAKEVAMTAGARVLEVLSCEDAEDYRCEVLREIRPDIVLLTGGTDGGDTTGLASHAEVVASAVEAVNAARPESWKPEVILGGNRDGQEAAGARLRKAGVPFRRVPNILPTIHELRVKPAREAIHEQFIRQITRAPGLGKLLDMVADGKIMPTPGAVLLGAELLARGTAELEGLGNLMVVDMGGATTDIHSVIPDLDALAIEERGLIVSNEKQVSFRTVEGNLGMRVSAAGIVETLGARGVLACGDMEAIVRAFGRPLDAESLDELAHRLEAFADHLEAHPETLVPEDDSLESAFEFAMAVAAVRTALRRHAGHVAADANPVMGITPGMPVGRDTRPVTTVIAVGGVFTHWSEARSEDVLRRAFAEPGLSLLPTDPAFVPDKNYLLYAVGVLAQSRAHAALRLGLTHFKQL